MFKYITLEIKSSDLELRIHDKNILLQHFHIGNNGSKVLASAVMVPSINSVLFLGSRA